ncbi:MAG: hypothetical protein IJU52_09365 [Clostridia bacterium]|nr:hypothetical protein [Clostridia bacterium]
METFSAFVVLYLTPLAIAALVVAIILLVKRKKKNGVRPPYARGFLIAAICLFVFVAIAAVLLLISLVYFAIMVIRVGESFLWAALKSL